MPFRSDPSLATIWLDVSVLVKCNTHQPTGIPRTAAELVRAFWRIGCTNVRLCRFDLDLGAYTEVPAERLVALFPALAADHVHGSRQADGPCANLVRRDRLADRARRSVRLACSAAVRLLARMARSLHERYLAVRRYLGPARRISEQWWGRPLLQAWRKVARCWKQKVLRSELALGPSDVVVSVGGGWNYPGNGPTCRRLRERLGFRSVHIIYDLIPVKFPQLFRTGFADMIDGWLYETFQSADLLLTISRHTRRDVLEYCARQRLTAPPIEVVRLGELISPGGAADTPPANDSFDTAQPFVLSVGTLEIRKNHLLLYHIWRRLLEQHGPAIPRLVLVGSLGWLTAEVLHQIRQDPLTREHVVVITHCDDEQLRSLYQHCLFTMYPSHYEGWGLPIAESLALGKYCIASNTSSMPEIGGDLVGMHDPCDVLGCLCLVTEALDPDFRAAREERIRRHYRRTSWDETAGQLLSQIDRHFGSTVAPPFEEVARSA